MLGEIIIYTLVKSLGEVCRVSELELPTCEQMNWKASAIDLTLW